jgi:predicted nucleic acid-binding protein
MRVLIDTNVALDFLLEREPFVEAAGSTIAIDAVSQILTDLNICMVDRQILKQAVDLNFQDF